MSGGVDSSVAASLLVDEGHEVVGATLKLWDGADGSRCCSAADVRDARRVCDQIGVEHHVFNYTGEFAANVLVPYVSDHAAGRTPNPCVECNRHLKFGALVERAERLGFDAIATGHHARVERAEGSARPALLRGADAAKDQSYVLAVLTGDELARVLLPVGSLTKDEVRDVAARRGLATAAKPDSQDVCFLSSGRPGEGPLAARRTFLAGRVELHAGRALDAASGEDLGEVPAVELVTVGQRRGLPGGGATRRYAIAVDTATRRVLVGRERDLLVDEVPLRSRTWVGEPLAPGERCSVQSSAHGRAVPATSLADRVTFASPARRVAPGQLVALYVGDEVVGSGVAC